MRFLIVTAVIALAHCAAVAQPKTSITLDDIHRLVDITEPAFSPDGEYIVYTASTHNLDTDETVSDLWRVSWSSEAQQLTNTPDTSEWAPAYGGDVIAFLSDATKTEETQLFVMPAKGGKARQVSTLPGGVSEFALSPDGATIIATAEVGANTGADPEKPLPIVINRFYFKEDGRDYIDDRRLHLFRIDVATGAAEQLTEGAADYFSPSWSPDGTQFAYVAKDTYREDRHFNFEVYVMAPVKGASPRKVSNYKGADADPDTGARPQWSPDGSKLLWLQSGADKWIYYAPFELTVADLTSGDVKPLARIDRWIYSPRWSADGASVIALVEQDRDTLAARIDAETGAIEYLTRGARFAFDLAVSSNDRIAILEGTNERPYELKAIEYKIRPLTNHNDWVAGKVLTETGDISFVSGKEVIHGLLVLPEGYQVGRRYPLIVRLHGGPVYQYSHEFMFDWRLYAANGYAVLAVNPRGSSGRGFDFARATFADWGDKDAIDISSGIDHAIALGIADPDRIGAGGWSYGAMLTNYLIASDPRIKAAVSGAGMSNFLAGYGADQYAQEYELELGLPWRNREAYERVSYPFFRADRITAPTLFQCAGSDMNVPCIGSEQMYQALKSLEVDTQLVIYPGENHTLTRPSFIRDRLERNLQWYDKYLKGEH